MSRAIRSLWRRSARLGGWTWLLLAAGATAGETTSAPDVARSTPAAESVIGLPPPRDPQRPGAVLLYGGGAIAPAALDRFVELAGGPQARILFVPCAGSRLSEWSNDATYEAALRVRFATWFELV